MIRLFWLHNTAKRSMGWLGLALLLAVSACTSARTLPPVTDCNAIPEAVVAAQSQWDSAELRTLCSLWLETLPPLPPDPTNAVADSAAAADLGERLFFDTRLSGDGSVACATCHDPALAYTDGRTVAVGMGEGTRNTPTIVGTQYSPWFFWDGHKDSQWSQALEPLESPHEHGTDRNQIASLLASDAAYAAAYAEVFGVPPSTADAAAVATTFANVGKAIAAYERTIMFAPARFDEYVALLLQGEEEDAAALFSADEQAGLRLFIGQAECTFCHNGPLFTNNAFHNTAVAAEPDAGRFEGAQLVLADEFNCLTRFSDDPNQCAELRFIKTDRFETFGAFKTPTLRDIALTAPYMHAGQEPLLRDAIAHYNNAPLQSRDEFVFGHNELNALYLTGEEMSQLEAFLLTLTSPIVP